MNYSPSNMTVTPQDGGPGPHSPVSPHGNASVGFMPGNANDDNEEKGRQALDRITRLSRGVHDGRALAPRKRLRRPAPWDKPPAITEQPRSLHHKAVPTADTQEEDDVAEAIRRSLRDVPACHPVPQSKKQHGLDDLDVMEIDATAFTPNHQPRTPVGKARSYNALGSDCASTAAVPHAALHDLLGAMDASIETLDKCTLEGTAVNAQELMVHLRKWQGTINRVIYESESAERRRIRDIRAQLDFDRKVEEAHRNSIDRLNQSWEAMVHEKEQEWQEKMSELTQAIATRQHPGELYATLMHSNTHVQRRC